MQLFDTSLNDNMEVIKGDVLVAEPFLDDPNFARSVILICEHKEEGAFGLVINKPVSVDVEDVPDPLIMGNDIFVGGPVEQNTLHVIHTFDMLDGSTKLQEGVFWGGNYDELKLLHMNGEVSSKNCRLFVGYSGWGKNQLEEELNKNSWVIAKIDLKKIFEIEPENLWQEVLRSMGSKYKMLSNYPIDPRLN
ncbi:YqgE/AlgH family protein [Flammeovirgaceae bacterium SG7u.111]|nr:YqgE/AlgH family protein [Flammeovirgaceae bacterium SG7u.132]WPO33516.1 YqgE/AlgH family protein [Flammeovirgaceae bacterium SG7u.111]